MWLKADRLQHVHPRDLVLGWPVIAYAVTLTRSTPDALDPLERAILELAATDVVAVSDIAAWLGLKRSAVAVETCRRTLIDSGSLGPRGHLTDQGRERLKGTWQQVGATQTVTILRDVLNHNWLPFLIEGGIQTDSAPAAAHLFQVEPERPAVLAAPPANQLEYGVRRATQFRKQQGAEAITTLADREAGALVTWVSYLPGSAEFFYLPVIIHPAEKPGKRMRFSDPFRDDARDWLERVHGIRRKLPEPVQHFLETRGQWQGTGTATPATPAELPAAPIVERYLPYPTEIRFTACVGRLQQLAEELDSLAEAKPQQVSGWLVHARSAVEEVFDLLVDGLQIHDLGRRLWGPSFRAAGPADGKLAEAQLAAIGVEQIPATVRRAMADVLARAPHQPTPREAAAALLLTALAEQAAGRLRPEHDGVRRFLTAQQADPFLLAELMEVVALGNMGAHPADGLPDYHRIERGFVLLCRHLMALAVDYDVMQGESKNGFQEQTGEKPAEWHANADSDSDSAAGAGSAAGA